MTKIKLAIKNRWTGSIIFEYEKEDNTLRDTVLEYIRQARADLTDANLTDADLTDADLTRADLTRANLTRANLTRADLTDADLTDANLTRANLTRADLTDADLTRADLTRADLTDADLTRADLTRADLTDADLTDADLTRADLTVFKDDFFAVLVRSIPEIAFLKQNIIEGKIDGSTYDGACSCLSGTLARGAREHNGPRMDRIVGNILSCRNSSRPIERLFLNIKKGDTPETNPVAKYVLDWLEEFEGYIAPPAHVVV